MFINKDRKAQRKLVLARETVRVLADETMSQPTSPDCTSPTPTATNCDSCHSSPPPTEGCSPQPTVIC